MSVVLPGDGVLDLMRGATSRVVIVAPYIKSSALQRLIKVLPSTVSECICTTRWLPEDVASGVCDLEILDDISQIQGGRLLIHRHLHAKYYSNGHQSLVGSANLTARGLGWHKPSNAELLVTLPAEFPGLIEWETDLLASAVPATNDLRESIRAQAEQLKQDGLPPRVPEVEEESVDEVVFWVPRCPAPDRLWEVYCGIGEDRMARSTFETAKHDLAILSPPSGLGEKEFMGYLAMTLRYTPLFHEIDELAKISLTDTRAHEYLSERLVDEDEPQQTWVIVKRWIDFFLPTLYRLETDQDILVKGRRLDTMD